MTTGRLPANPRTRLKCLCNKVNEKQVRVSKQEHISTLLQNDGKFLFTFSIS